MKTLMLFAVLLVPASLAQASPNDALEKLGGPVGFCNVLEKAKGLPQTNASCGAIISLSERDFSVADLQAFGRISNVLHAGDQVFLITTVTIEELEALRFDPRIVNIAPDFPVGGVGSFTVRN